MFDGADLSAVYGMPTYDQPMMSAPTAPQVIPQPTQQPQQIPANPHVVDVNAYGKSTTSHSAPPDAQYAPPNAMYAQQLPHPKSYAGDVSFWDKIGQKKFEILKMVVLSLVIVLALSFDRVAGHYLEDYVSKAILTSTQELMVRISYPVGVVLFLWIMKAMM
ncbi:hypothetical protein [Dishui Lake large algae virus 1]|nr:hypothetical protein [Dishui Lake large algae virus 1]